jgi:acetyl-CoA C-acetyltransferase
MNKEIVIIGIGQTKVGEHWEVSLRHLAWQAIEAALDDAAANGLEAINQIEALYVGNMLGGLSSQQDHLGALIADYAGLRGVEAVTVEAGEASGATAVRQAILAVQSGQVQMALAVGVEKATDETGAEAIRAMTTSLDADFESIHGATLPAMAGLLMQRYMHEHGVTVGDFANFSVNAHANGAKNEYAMFRNRIRADKFPSAPLVADPVNLFDAAPVADGAAAVIVTTAEVAYAANMRNVVKVLASAMATDAFSLHDRDDILHLNAVKLSAEKAFKQAGHGRDAINLLELHDAFTIMTTLALEAMGYSERGAGYQFNQIPLSTFGGLKARGNPLGATGVYQIVELARQLRGQAGDNQLPDVKIGLAQNIGGVGSTAVTHILGI